MTKRKQITKKVRFETFKRDGFTCQYCGQTPPATVLEIDHIHPVSKGGDNSEENLTTSCFDCNRGKSSNELSAVPNTLIEKSQVLKEKEDQLSGLKKLRKQVKARKTREINKLEKCFQSFYQGITFTELTKSTIKRSFLPQLDVEILIENIEAACLYIDDDPHRAYKYFCGICWQMIKEHRNG